MFLRIYSAEVTLSDSASNVSSAAYVRLVVTGTTARVVTLKESGGATIGTITLLPYQETLIRKTSSDTLSVETGVTDVKAVSVGIAAG